MRKLTPDEEHALAVLTKHDGFCPGRDYASPFLIGILRDLVRKGRVVVEMTDDGPRYTAVPE